MQRELLQRSRRLTFTTIPLSRMPRFPGDDIPIVSDAARTTAAMRVANVYDHNPVSHAQVPGG